MHQLLEIFYEIMLITLDSEIQHEVVWTGAIAAPDVTTIMASAYRVSGSMKIMKHVCIFNTLVSSCCRSVSRLKKDEMETMDATK